MVLLCLYSRGGAYGNSHGYQLAVSQKAQALQRGGAYVKQHPPTFFCYHRQAPNIILQLHPQEGGAYGNVERNSLGTGHSRYLHSFQLAELMRLNACNKCCIDVEIQHLSHAMRRVSLLLQYIENLTICLEPGTTKLLKTQMRVMSSESTNTTIKRFTYDWLIRFAELHPLQSRHVDISPRFRELLTRHALEVVAFDSLIMIGGNYWEKTGTKCRIDTTSPHRKKQLYQCDECFLINLTPGMITTFEKDRVFFNGVALNIIAFQPERKLLSFSNLLPILPPVFMSTITPKELKYLLKYRNATKAILLEVQLAEPVMFSEIWPLMDTCDTSIKISIGNFIYDKDMAAVFRKNPIRQSELYFHRMNLSDTEVLALFDYLLSLQVRPTMLSLRFEKKMPVELARAINAKYNFNGLRTIFFPLPTTPFNAIIIQESQLNGKAVCCEYSLNHSLSADIIP